MRARDDVTQDTHRRGSRRKQGDSNVTQCPKMTNFDALGKSGLKMNKFGRKMDKFGLKVGKFGLNMHQKVTFLYTVCK